MFSSPLLLGNFKRTVGAQKETFLSPCTFHSTDPRSGSVAEDDDDGRRFILVANGANGHLYSDLFSPAAHHHWSATISLDDQWQFYPFFIFALERSLSLRRGSNSIPCLQQFSAKLDGIEKFLVALPQVLPRPSYSYSPTSSSSSSYINPSHVPLERSYLRPQPNWTTSFC